MLLAKLFFVNEGDGDPVVGVSVEGVAGGLAFLQ